MTGRSTSRRWMSASPTPRISAPRFRSSETGGFKSLFINRKALLELCPHAEDLIARPLNANAGVKMLLQGYYDLVIENAHNLDALAKNTAAQHLTDLVVLALGTGRDETELVERSRTGRGAFRGDQGGRAGAARQWRSRPCRGRAAPAASAPAMCRCCSSGPARLFPSSCWSSGWSAPPAAARSATPCAQGERYRESRGLQRRVLFPSRLSPPLRHDPERHAQPDAARRRRVDVALKVTSRLSRLFGDHWVNVFATRRERRMYGIRWPRRSRRRTSARVPWPQG